MATLAAVLVLAVAPRSEARTDQEHLEAELYELHNRARVERGLAPLVYDPGLTAIARDWAGELRGNGRLQHNPNLAAAVETWVTRDWTRLGENVGFAASPRTVFDAYMASPTHRDNVLGDVNRVGVGVERGDDGRLWTTIVFMRGPPL